MTSSVIDTASEVVTLINVFTCEPARQQDLVTVLDEATSAVIRHRPGFISANIHAALDGTKVTNYAQWASVADFEAMLADPQSQEHMAAAAALGSFDPGLYRVASVHHA